MSIDDRVPSSLAVLQVMRKGRLDRRDIAQIMSETEPTELGIAFENLRREIDEAFCVTRLLNWMDSKLARFF